jgi:hypothetical protein
VASHFSPADIRLGLSEQRRQVDFDTYDVTVDELIRRVKASRIDIAPVYQRQFRWDDERQSRLVESVLLGIPVPPLFMATNTSDLQDRWEVVDGLQRLLSLVHFAGDAETRESASLAGDPLRLRGLDKLTSFLGRTYAELPEDVRSFFLDRPMKVVVLNDKSQLEVRYDLFERLNTGGISLTPQEIREAVFRGDFIDLLGKLASTIDFKTVVVLPKSKWIDGTPEDFVLRFFAFKERYQTFDHSVKEFLTSFVSDAAARPLVVERRAQFERTFSFLALRFPDGLKTRKGQTPVNLFEGVAVGAALALEEVAGQLPSTDLSWVHSEEMRRLTTGATNSRKRVVGRIERSRDGFLGRLA